MIRKSAKRFSEEIMLKQRPLRTDVVGIGRTDRCSAVSRQRLRRTLAKGLEIMPCKMTCIGVAASQGGPDNRGLRSGCRKQLARPLQADQSGKLHGRAAAKLAERTKKRPRSNARDRNEFFDRNQAR
ncbi:hypothetical protein chiPu_0033356, partial [Chiloscyllium punctatum]|nr:hypothetical protein [Chiloscyllium punctatum]